MRKYKFVHSSSSMGENVSDELLKKGATYTMQKLITGKDYLTALEAIIMNTGVPTKYLRSREIASLHPR
jgi:hypothetical protein